MKQTPNDSKNNGLSKIRHPFEYRDFIDWIATPASIRSPKTQTELAKKFGVGQDTLSEWKQRQGFFEEVYKKRKEWGHEKTPDVILALYKRIIKTGSAAEVKLWLQYFENWFEQTITIEPPTRRYAHLTNQELADHIKKAKDFLLKRK